MVYLDSLGKDNDILTEIHQLALSLLSLLVSLPRYNTNLELWAGCQSLLKLHICVRFDALSAVVKVRTH